MAGPGLAVPHLSLPLSRFHRPCFCPPRRFQAADFVSPLERLFAFQGCSVTFSLHLYRRFAAVQESEHQWQSQVSCPLLSTASLERSSLGTGHPLAGACQLSRHPLLLRLLESSSLVMEVFAQTETSFGDLFAQY